LVLTVSGLIEGCNSIINEMLSIGQ
jgi:hypothetical protein